jgi:chromosomal replication initiator protein DnaA
MGFIDNLLKIFGGKKKEPPRPVRRPPKKRTPASSTESSTSTVVRTPPASEPIVRRPRQAQAQHVDDDTKLKKKEAELVKKEQAFLKELEDEWVKRELQLKQREDKLLETQQELEQERLQLATESQSVASAEAEATIAEMEQREQELMRREEMLRKELDSLRTLPEGDQRVDMAKREEELKRRETEIQKRAEELDIDEMMRNIEEKMKEEVTEPLREYVFDNFVIGDSNRFAFEVSMAVSRAPADAYNPLFVYSSVGMGKTHLLNAIGNYIKEQNPTMKIVYVSCEKFTNELINFLQYGKIEEFREKYRTVDVLLIDDIQFIALQQSTQEEFFHTFNALYNAHKQIVLASDRPPKDIQHLEARLRSRFEGGLIVNIKIPDLPTRKNIIEHKALEAGITLDPKVSDFIARYIQADVRTLIGSLNNILAHSSLTGRQINLTLVSEVLKNMWPESEIEA